MPAGRFLACEPEGPLGTLIPRGPLCFGGAQLPGDRCQHLHTFLQRGGNR
jgi:hypothetical protein